MSPRSFAPRWLGSFALLLLSAGALAGAREDVEASMQKFIALKSYHATMQMGGAQSMTTQLDFVAPDRYRISTPAGAQHIIGDQMVMTIQGHTMRVPVPKGTLAQWRDPASIHKNTASSTFTALGVGVVDGKPARKYRMVNRQSPETSSVMWIGGDGYPLQIEVSGKTRGKPVTTTIRYSRFNDPTLRIAAP